MTAEKGATSTSHPERSNESDVSGCESLPSTTVAEIDIATPKSVTSSASTITSIVPKATQTATSTVPEPTLQTLNEDILARISSHILSDSYRGTPHYPSKECPDALRFAQSSSAFSDAVGRHLTSDHPWLDVSDADMLTKTGPKPAFMQKVLAWYTIAAPYLTSLHLHSKLAYFPNLRARAMDKLLDARPPLKLINLSSFDKTAEPSMHADLAKLLKYSRETISSITVDLTPKLLDVVTKARLTSVTTMEAKLGPHATADSLMEAKFGPHATADSLIQLLKSVSSRETPLTHLTLGSRPDCINPQALFAAAPHIRSMKHHQNFMDMNLESPEKGFLRLARAFKDIQKISLRHCAIDLASLHGLLDREKYPSFDKLELIQCDVRDLHPVLVAASDRITHLRLTQHIDRAALQIIGRCKKVEELGLAMQKDVVEGLKDCVKNLEELRELTLSLYGAGPRVERQVIEALEYTRKKFEKFVLHGETLQYEGIRHMMRILGPQLQYWVTGIYTPTKSRTRVIMRLLKDTAQYNPNMKVLCFGLGLTYDRRGAELHEEFLRSIEVVGKRLGGLDTYWLKQNAKSILALERPEQFVEYESDESDVEVF